jgi:YfiH family protein
MDLSNDNVIHVKKGQVEYLQFRKLLEYKDIVTHAYTLGKNVNFRTAKANKEPLEKEIYKQNTQNYKDVCEKLGQNYINIVKCNQEHTKNVASVKEKVNKNEPDFNVEKYNSTDGLITNKKDIILATTNADCILMLFFDPQKKVIANVHSGWKGTLQEISIEAVKKMKEEYSCNAEDIMCFICPSIRKCHFEVDQEVKDLFYNKFKKLYNIEEIIEENKEKNKWHIDTVLINRTILKQEGLKEENIIDSGLCSVCNSDIIHSFRVEKEGYGLETALIALK